MKCKIYIFVLPSHFFPWCIRPYSKEPQWSQNVGLEYVWILKWCGDTGICKRGENRGIRTHNKLEKKWLGLTGPPGFIGIGNICYSYIFVDILSSWALKWHEFVASFMHDKWTYCRKKYKCITANKCSKWDVEVYLYDERHANREINTTKKKQQKYEGFFTFTLKSLSSK